MKAIKVDLGSEIKELRIYTFADFHIGDMFCDIKNIIKMIDEVKKDENGYVILNGDIINNATKTSISDCYAEKMKPMEQIATFTNLFGTIKNKILAVTQGNHEKRTYNKEGIDITRLVCEQLGISDRYSPTSALIFLRFGQDSEGHKETKDKSKIRKLCYTIYCTHGSGGGRKEGAKAIRLADMASTIDADIYIHSHTHLPMIMKECFFRTDTRNSSFGKVDKLFVNTSSQLDYGGYGEAFEFKPNSKHTPIIYLSGIKKIANAKL